MKPHRAWRAESNADLVNMSTCGPCHKSDTTHSSKLFRLPQIRWFVAQGTVAPPLSSRFELVWYIIQDEIVLFKSSFSGVHERTVSLSNPTGQSSQYITASIARLSVYSSKIDIVKRFSITLIALLVAAIAPCSPVSYGGSGNSTPVAPSMTASPTSAAASAA